MAFSNGAGEGGEMAPSESGGGGESSGGGGLPLPGLGENGGGESGAGAEGGEQGMPVAQQDEESGEGEGFGRHDGVILFRDEQTGGDPEGMRLPATTTHYTLSENLQSVRTCTEANDACVIQASVVFRDGEIERVRLFDEYIVGEPVPHEPDSGNHNPPH